MDNVVLPAVQYDGELELESLGLCLFDVDVDLDECFKNCPEWNVSGADILVTKITPGGLEEL